MRTIKVGYTIERRYHSGPNEQCVWLPVRVTYVWRDALYYGDCYVLLRDEGVTWRRVAARVDDEDETK